MREAVDNPLTIDFEKNDLISLRNVDGTVIQVYRVKTITDTGLIRLWQSGPGESIVDKGFAEFARELERAHSIEIEKHD